ncbi:NAD(P)/FAD-dependent oxidoreductase [Halovenus salina]|uniref:NAD(P)/FAD-dependent oxidoreductase n=1 Tax=Halovenus salina TaxID=1510225 RepID=UPI002260C4B4|nr:NAD(P)/FAD-dependent oxidoreductase [Halovenus salina]
MGTPESASDHDVIVVGGGPAGCSAGVFTARYGLDTVIFDKGSAALPRCAYLENYLGFPAGIGIDDFTALMHAHVSEVGCNIIEERVEAVTRSDAGERFVIETQTGEVHSGKYVIAAAWYDGSYLRGLDDDAMFEQQEHHGESEERFDPDYHDEDGRTPVDRLYVASPAGARSAQAIVVAGHGAHVARCLLEDHRRERGYSGGVAPHYDWLRSDAEFAGEWAERDRWRTWFNSEMEADLPEDRLAELQEAYIDHAFDTHRSDQEVETATERGLRRLVEVIGPDRILNHVDDDLIRERGKELEEVETTNTN